MRIKRLNMGSRITARLHALRPGLAGINLPAKAGALYTLVGIISRAAGFLFTPVFTRILTSAEYGAYSLFNSYLSILAIIGSLEIPGGVLYRILQRNSGDEESVMASAQKTVLISSFLSLILFIAFMSIFGGGEIFPGFYITICISSIFRILINLYASRERYHYRKGTICLIGISESIATPLLSLLLFALLPADGKYHVTIKALSHSLILLLVFVTLFIYTRSKRNVTQLSGAGDGHIREILKVALPMLPYYVSLILLSQAMPTLVSMSLGKEAVGGYGIAYALGSAPTMLLSGTASVLMPWIMRKLSEGKEEKVKSLITKLTRVIAPLTLAFLCIAPEGFSFLAPSAYHGALGATYTISLSALPLFLGGLNTTAALTTDRHMGIIVSGVVPATALIAFSGIVLSSFGVSSAGAIILISYTIFFLISLYNLKRISGFSLINVNDYIQISLYMLLFTGIIYTVREILPLRIIICLILLMLSGAYLYRCTEFIKEKGDRRKSESRA